MDNFNDKYKKKNPFTVPENYFDELTERIMERTAGQEKSRKIKFVQRLKPYMSLAAIFILALWVVQAIFPLVVNKDQLMQRDSIEYAIQALEPEEEDIFDSQFNPTGEEIIEYLASEVDSYELMYAGIY